MRQGRTGRRRGQKFEEMPVLALGFIEQGAGFRPHPGFSAVAVHGPLNAAVSGEVQGRSGPVSGHCDSVGTMQYRLKGLCAAPYLALIAATGYRTGLEPLAGHLGVAPSTLSAALARLAKLGYLTNKPNERDRRKREVRLTSRGAEAISATSVLDAERVRALLSKLKPDERKAALRGLALLAQAARKM